MKKGALCLFLITIKAPQSLLTPKVLKSHQKDEKAVITGGSVSLRLGSLMQQGKNKNVQGRDGCEMGVGWGGKLCSMTTSSELGKCSSVNPTVWPQAHGHRASYITALDAQTCAFLAGSHRFTYYYLGSYLWRDSIEGRHRGASSSTRKVSCVSTQSWLRTLKGKRGIWFSPVKPALLFVHGHNIILLPLEKML